VRYLRVASPFTPAAGEVYIGPVYTPARMGWVKDQLKTLYSALEQELKVRGLVPNSQDVLQKDIPSGAQVLETHEMDKMEGIFRRQYHDYYDDL
jgi:hypothetical protein